MDAAQKPASMHTALHMTVTLMLNFFCIMPEARPPRQNSIILTENTREACEGVQPNSVSRGILNTDHA